MTSSAMEGMTADALRAEIEATQERQREVEGRAVELVEEIRQADEPWLSSFRTKLPLKGQVWSIYHILFIVHGPNLMVHLVLEVLLLEL